MLICATGLHAMSVQTVLSSQLISSYLMSTRLWQRIVELLGGRISTGMSGDVIAQVDLGPIAIAESTVALLTVGLGAWWIARRRGVGFSQALADWSLLGWLWWLVPGAWEVAQWFAPQVVRQFLAATPHLWCALMLAGWLATFFALSSRTGSQTVSPITVSPIEDNYRAPVPVLLAVAAFVLVFVAMNWQLYHGLWVPHGDSAMYEEHLWNLMHGKGFRSYLDQGLFLGEHIQVVHVALTPLHMLWSDHRLLELCESLALASAAIPVFWIARRHTRSRSAAMLLACAYLLYVPMHYLDIAIDLKTFRPTSFGVPLLLLAIDQWERGRLRTSAVLLVLTLSAKEEYAIVIACFGAWMAVCGHRRLAGGSSASATSERIFGGATAVCATAYLLLAVWVVIPWFRSGEEVHYTRYFDGLGNSPGEIVRNAITQPSLVLGKFFSGRSVYYALVLLLPLGLLPLRSPGRLAVAAPLFGMLCLLELDGPVVPLHHFHAPVIPILMWSAAAGLGCLFPKRGDAAVAGEGHKSAFRFPNWAARFACTSALATSCFLSLSPIGVPFWDPGSRHYWRSLYVPGKRAEMFPQVYELIPPDSRVASTDFVHPRFTHHERSYDYSDYKRKVSGYELRVPDDTDFIVIDTQHPYSEVRAPADVRELKRDPDGWELLPDTTEGYFIVLRRSR